nr:uncharacterized protein LOC120962914 [Aegilops tauschii subsp. strangulata]
MALLSHLLSPMSGSDASVMCVLMDLMQTNVNELISLTFVHPYLKIQLYFRSVSNQDSGYPSMYQPGMWDRRGCNRESGVCTPLRLQDTEMDPLWTASAVTHWPGRHWAATESAEFTN